MRILKFFHASILFFVSMFIFSNTAFAHLISILPVTPFPSQVEVGTTTTATYSVMNITSQTPLTVVDQSKFPTGLTIQSSTCGLLMQPAESCQITLELQASSKPQTISTYLKEWAMPAADGVQFPIVVSVVMPTTFTVTPVADANGTISPNTVQTVTSGGSVMFVATPAPNYVTNQWLVDGEPAQTGGATFTLSNITANHTVEVSFAITQFTVTPESGGNGTISPNTVQTVNSGGNFTFMATPSANFSTAQWLVNGDPAQTSGNMFTLMDVTANDTVEATFAINAFTITPSAGSNGTISPNTAEMINSGGNATFEATPASGFAVDQWLVDGSPTPVQTGGTSYTLMNVTADHSVEVTFEVAQFTVTPTAGANGTIKPSTPQPVNFNGSVPFTATPNANYHVNQWLVDGELAQTGGNDFTLTNITANHTVEVTFAITQFTVTPSSGGNGTISPATPQTVNSGSNITFTATPATGYKVNQWLVDGTPAQTGGTGFTLSTVKANHSVEVTFTIQTFTVTPSAGVDGTISPNTPQTVNYGSNITFTATPATNFSVNQWLVDGAVKQTGGDTFILTNVITTHTVEVTFVGAVTLTAVGQSSSGPLPTLLAVSTDGGLGWGTISSITNLSTSVILNASDCTGTGSTAICTAVGQSPNNADQWILSSTDGGNTWSATGFTGFVSGNLKATSCTGAGATAICLAVGQVTEPTTIPSLYISTNGTASFTQVSGVSVNGFLNGASCTGTGGTAICIAAGQNTSTAATPYLYVSTNAGSTWATPSSIGFTGNGIFNGASCVGSGATAICTAAGQDTTNNLPLLVVTTNGTSTWTKPTIVALPAGTFNATSCTGTGSTAICTAVGQNTTGSTPLLVVSTNGGSTFAIKSVTGLSAKGTYKATSCTGSGATAICIAAGKNTTSNLPLLVVSTNGGSTWSGVSIASLPTGTFNAASCTGNGTTAKCSASGVTNAGAPYVVTSTNGGSTWANSTVANAPASGTYFGAGSTGG